MATLTSAQRKMLQRYLGIRGDQTVFTDAELDENFDEAGGSVEKAVVVSLLQMLGDDAKMQAYTLGADGLNKQEVFDKRMELLRYWEKRTGMSVGAITTATLDYGTDTGYPTDV